MSKHIRANDMTDEERESETPEQRAWRMAMRENPMVARTDAEMKRLMALPIEEREAMAKEMMAGCKPQHMVADEEAARLAKPSEPEPVDDTPEVAKGIERAIEAGQPPSDDQHMLIEALQAIQAQLQQGKVRAHRQAYGPFHGHRPWPGRRGRGIARKREPPRVR
jgi:hypothetical protein